MFKKKTDKEIQTLKELKEKYGKLTALKYYIPEWRDSGGKNAELQNDAAREIDDSEKEFWVPQINDMNWLEITKQKKRSLKYPQPRCIDLLDAYLLKEKNKKSGFASKPCSSFHFKQYYINCQPKDELGLFECWSRYSKYDDGTKEQ